MAVGNPTHVDIVIPTYNGANHLPRLLESIYLQAFKAYRCIVVDDHSTDGTADLVKKKYPWVRLIAQSSNRGPAVNRNIAAKAGNSPFIAIFDDDTFLEDRNWLGKAMQIMEESPEIGQLASRIVSGFEPEVLLDCGIYADGCLFGGIYHRQNQQTLNGRHEKPRRVLGACSAGTVLRREAFHRAGGFDPKYFYPVEDLDLSLRIHLAGYDVRYAPSLVTYHLESQAMGKSLRRKMYMYRRNCLLAMVENYPAAHSGRVLLKVLVGRIAFPFLTRLLEKAGLAEKRGDLREALDYTKSFLFLGRHAFGILRKRLKTNRSLKRPRSYLLRVNQALIKDIQGG